MKDIIYVESHTYTTASNFSLIFRNVITKKDKKIPFTDVDYIIFDHPRSYFSTKLILKCRENKVGILFCNEKHTPISTLYPEYNYHQKLERLQQQIKLPQRVKNRLWRKIIKAKIMNQSLCLQHTVHNQASYKQLQLKEKSKVMTRRIKNLMHREYISVHYLVRDLDEADIMIRLIVR